MRLLIRAVLVLAVLAVVGIGALALFLPRLAESDAVKARLQQAARDAIGREVTWDGLAVGLFPPRLVVQGPSVAGDRPSDPAILQARNVDLQVALAPLLTRTVLIDSLQVEGVTLRLVRTPDGIRLPIPAGSATAKEGGAAAPDAGAAAGVALAVRELQLVDSRIELDDRAVKPGVRWVLDGVEASARGTSLEAPLDVDLRATLGSGGSIRVAGKVGLDARGDLEALLDDLVLEPLAPYVGAGSLAGRVSGEVRLAGDLANPDTLIWDVRLAGARIAQQDLVLNGAVATRGELEGGFERGTGAFSADATDAELRYGDAFHKPAGRRATVSGTLVADPKTGLGIDGMKLSMDSIDATGRVRTAPRMKLELEAPSVDVASLARLLPALADRKPAGSASVSGLVVQTEPLDVRGSVQLSALRLPVEGGDTVELSGAIDLAGNRLASRALQAGVGGQVVPIDLSVTDLAGAPRLRLVANTERANLDALVKALAGQGGTITGALTSNVALNAPLVGNRPFLEALGGDGRIDVRDGRIKGVSLLEGTVEKLGAVGQAALLLGSLRGGKSLQRFYDDAFDSITGSFRLASGKARTDDLRIVYRNYTLDLRGAYGLVDAGLDFDGKITIDREVAAALAPDGSGGTGDVSAPPPEPRVIPLAHVGGTLSSPRVNVTPAAAVAFASSFAVRRGRGDVERKIDERLGEGAAKEIFGTLEGILGGPKKQPPPED